MKMLRCFLYVKLTDYLNGLKKVLLHSHTTKLPNLIIEAMACDTPILATPLGAIPCMIEDGKTGFITENSLSECIAKNIIRALKYPDLERIEKNAGPLVRKKITYESAVKRYRKILEVI